MFDDGNRVDNLKLSALLYFKDYRIMQKTTF